MNLLMISGDRSVLQGKKGAFWYMLEEFRKYWGRIDVICPKCKSPHPHLLPKGEGTSPFENVFFHPAPHGLWYQPRWIVKKGKQLAREHGHGVISVHEYPPFYNGIGAEWLSRVSHVPYVLEVHHIVGYPKPASVAEFFGRVLSHLFLPHDAEGARAVRCVSRGPSDLLEKWGANIKKLFIIPSFYLDRLALTPNVSIEKRHDVVCCGRLVANKGFGNVLRAIALLPKTTLLLIGDGPQRDHLSKLAARLRISNRVAFAGWLKDEIDVYRAMQSAKIFVMNSASEGGPRAALEAMALGLPVIATPVGVMPDILSEGVNRNGYITTGHPKDLSEKIEKLIAYPSLCSRLGLEARKILDRFEKTQLLGEYAQFLQSHARAS
ncbi:MAG: glycosyltransferase [Patescibacteria group bacterium]